MEQKRFLQHVPRVDCKTKKRHTFDILEWVRSGKIFLLKTKDDVREIIATTMQKVLIPACKPFNSYEII